MYVIMDEKMDVDDGSNSGDMLGSATLEYRFSCHILLI
jgi:hypothetical protein